MNCKYSKEKIKKMVRNYVETEKESIASIEDSRQETNLMKVKLFDMEKLLLAAISNLQFIKVVEFVVKNNRCNTGELQRKFKIGYSKAATYIDAMEALNLVSKFRVISDEETPSPREVLSGAKDFLEYHMRTMNHRL